MSVSSIGDTEGGKQSYGSRAWWRKAVVRLTGPARLNAPSAGLRRRAMTCRGSTGPDLGGVLGEAHIPQVVQAFLVN